MERKSRPTQIIHVQKQTRKCQAKHTKKQIYFSKNKRNLENSNRTHKFKKKTPKDVRVRIENMTPGQIKDKVEKIRQENQIKINEVKEKVGPP